jgi:hypothetical protein
VADGAADVALGDQRQPRVHRRLVVDGVGGEVGGHRLLRAVGAQEGIGLGHRAEGEVAAAAALALVDEVADVGQLVRGDARQHQVAADAVAARARVARDRPQAGVVGLARGQDVHRREGILAGRLRGARAGMRLGMAAGGQRGHGQAEAEQGGEGREQRRLHGVSGAA